MNKDEKCRKITKFVIDCGHEYFELPRPLSRIRHGTGIEKAIILVCLKRLGSKYSTSVIYTKYAYTCDRKYIEQVREALNKKSGWVYDKYILFEQYVIEEMRKNVHKIK